MIHSEQLRTKILPIAGGKGGVGKSVTAASLGILLGSYGKRTVLVDLDLGGSNLHTYLGRKNNKIGIGNYLASKDIKMDDILQTTEHENLRFIAGDVLVEGSANISYGQKRGLISALSKLDVDFILLDLGSGTHQNVIDFFLASNSGIIVSTPQAPAILNSYAFLKNAVFRHVHRSAGSNRKVSEYLKKLHAETTANSTPPMTEIVSRIKKLGKNIGTDVEDFLQAFKPHLILNMARSHQDLSIARSLRDLSRKNLDVELACLGAVYYEPEINQAVMEQRPFITGAASCTAGMQLDRLAQKLVHSPEFPHMPLDLEIYEDSFELAGIELESDGDPEATSETADLKPEELLEVMAAQKQEIQELRQTIHNLTVGGMR
ncbi:MAG: P-loop NTPase [Spirochaeta sp.]|nr:P-loop NTPase [Spirochaeta sp.]